MKTVLLLGAGRSSSCLIEYLLEHAAADGFVLRVGDLSVESAAAKTNGHPNAVPFAFEVENAELRKAEIAASDLVISMLPAALHILVAHDCLAAGKHLITASYVSPELMAIDEEVRKKGLLFMNECGLDPGIDHMSAVELIHRLRDQGATLTAFRSYTGGLVAPESNDNPWGYKFTWNPRNVILAGQGTARFIEGGSYRYIPYSRLYKDIQIISVDGLGNFDGYANRDSLSYRKHYGIETIPTLLRGTLRQSGYCSAWDVFVQLGLTDDGFVVEDAGKLTYEGLVDAFLPAGLKGSTTGERLASFCGIDTNGDIMDKIRYTGILEPVRIPMQRGTPAQILQQLLEGKWVLKAGDKDMIVMQHQFEYTLNNKPHSLHSTLVVKGEDTVRTAMAKTVGLPLGMVARRMLQGKIQLRGVQLPLDESVYEPVLRELETYGIRFTEQ